MAQNKHKENIMTYLGRHHYPACACPPKGSLETRKDARHELAIRDIPNQKDRRSTEADRQAPEKVKRTFPVTYETIGAQIIRRHIQ